MKDTTKKRNNKDCFIRQGTKKNTTNGKPNTDWLNSPCRSQYRFNEIIIGIINFLTIFFRSQFSFSFTYTKTSTLWWCTQYYTGNYHIDRLLLFSIGQQLTWLGLWMSPFLNGCIKYNGKKVVKSRVIHTWLIINFNFFLVVLLSLLYLYWSFIYFRSGCFSFFSRVCRS